MTLRLHEHPFAAYCWKALIALYERDLPFEPRVIEDEADRSRLAELWPMVSIPVLVDDRAGITLPESTAIVDYLDGLGEAPPLIPDDPVAALQARLWDRVIDGYLMTRCRRSSPTVCGPTDAATPRRRGGTGDAREGVRAAGQAPGGRGWAAGPEFTVADCAAAPALFGPVRASRRRRAPRPYHRAGG